MKLLKTNFGVFEYKDECGYSRRLLGETLAKFYRDVIFKNYNVNIFNICGEHKKTLQVSKLVMDKANDSIEEMILPGDLRHIAILNMMLQGYDPVEITRLAGHIDFDSKFGYENHLQFWVDSNIYQLSTSLSKLNLNLSDYEQNNVSIALHPKAEEMLKKIERRNAYLYNSDIEVNDDQKLRIGFCKSQAMPCPTFNFKYKGCYFCNHWGITYEEIKEKRELISDDLNIVYEEIKVKVNFLKNLLKVCFNESDSFDLRGKKDLNIATDEIKFGIMNASKLIYMLGVNSNE